MARRLAAAALIAAAVAAPFASPASALCQGVSTTAAGASYCDEGDYWVWCAGAGVTGVAGVAFCQPRDGAGLWMGCWTFQGLHCN